MWRILSKEARQFVASPLSLLVLLLLPCVVLWLAVHLPEARRVMRIYVEGATCGIEHKTSVEAAPCETPNADDVRRAILDAPSVRVVSLKRGEQDLWTFLGRNRLDAAFIWSPAYKGADSSVLGYKRGGVWTVYADPRDRSSAAALDLVVRLVEQNDAVNAELVRRNAAEQEANAPPPPLPGEPSSAADQPGAAPETPSPADSGTSAASQAKDNSLKYRLPSVRPLMTGLGSAANELDATPFVTILRNGPAPPNMSWLAPGLVTLISCFVAFLMGASSLARESEQGTLPLLASATNGGWLRIGLAKVFAAAAMGTFATLVMLTFCWLGLGQTPAAGFPLVLGIHVIGLFVCAVQGVAASAFLARQDQAFLVSGAYLVLLTLFSGVFFPIDAAGGAVEIVSWLLPPTFTQASVTDWMQHAIANFLPLRTLAMLLAVLSVSVAALIASLHVLSVRQ